MALVGIAAGWLAAGLGLLAAAVAGGGGGAASRRDEDHEFVRAAIEGDGTAYRGLVERYQERIYAIVYGIVHNAEDARELTQDTFVKAYRNLPRFRFDASFYTWLCRIAMNVSIDHLRRRRLRRTEEFDEGVAARDGDGAIRPEHHRGDPHREAERRELRERIFRAMDELPDEQKQVIVLREIEGLSYKEIAAVMQIPEGTVMSRLYYARRKLQAALADLRR